MYTYLYSQTPLIFGHRGASGYAPENTLAAFRLALEQGADGVELDVTLSADEVPVVIHDDTVDRTTDGVGRVGALTLTQLKVLSAACANKFGAQYKDEHIPTLAEVFQALGSRAIFNVELKLDASPGQQLAAEVVALIRAAGLEQRVLISSFYYENLQRVKRLAPALPVALLYAPDEPLRLLRAWFWPGVKADAHNPYALLVNPVTVRWWHWRGYRVHPWTVNSEPALRRVMRAGVDGVITNYPDLAVRVRHTLT